MGQLKVRARGDGDDVVDDDVIAEPTGALIAPTGWV